jgi:6-pyruvoyltetrahydropterin/6-carboxytetrahydropterin synthase
MFDATVEGAIDPQTGLIIDFKDLKKLFASMIEPFDHAMVLRNDDPLLHCLFNDPNAKLVVLDTNPTAENLAGLFFGILNNSVQEFTNGRCCVRNLQLFETQDGMAVAVRSGGTRIETTKS